MKDLDLCYYDLETYPNTFTASFSFENEEEIKTFEISDRKNDRDALLQFLSYLESRGSYMAGFNNIGFDYPIIHDLLNSPHTFNAMRAYQKCQEIINTQSFNRHASTIWTNDRKIKQVDFYRLHHFDNRSKATSLKALEFAMRMDFVEDLPFPVGTYLTNEQKDQLILYNHHDLRATKLFGQKSKEALKVRMELMETGVLRGDVLNFPDVKIGEQYLVSKIGREKCYKGKDPIQTFRDKIVFSEVILPKISFRTDEFNAVLDWFKSQTYYLHSEDVPSPRLETKLAGIDFVFGVGGVHASVENRHFESDDEHLIVDVDVSGMYVAIGVANEFAPEHLGKSFVTAYRQVQQDRSHHKKGTAMNATLKLAGNGVYGKSNDEWSPFYDPKYTFTVTANGQLQLLQLVEVFSLIPGLRLIQANTDGITCIMPRKNKNLFDMWKSDWESQTALKLEEVLYDKMWIRDVNSYIAIDMNGKVKRKGAYWYPEKDEEYDGQWHKDFSNMSAQKGVEQVLLHGYNPDAVVHCLTDKFDFMLRYKTTKGSVVRIGDKECGKMVRYYVSKTGEKMTKTSPPVGPVGTYKQAPGVSDALFKRITAEIPKGAWDARIHTKNKSVYTERVQEVEKGYLVKECNDASKFDFDDVDFSYYAEQIKKLMIGEDSGKI